MPARSTAPKRSAIQLGPAVLAAAVVGACLVPAASARLAGNTIDPVAMLTEGGRHITLTGPVRCTGGEVCHTRVTITQRSTGALAEGFAVFVCSGDDQEWQVEAWVQGEQAFERGPARAVALARTFDGGESTDAHQWVVNVRLQAE